jgi:hypothetical protein
MSTYLDVDALKTYLRIGAADVLDDVLLGQIVDAVEAHQRQRLVPAAFNAVAPPPGEDWLTVEEAEAAFSKLGHDHDLNMGTTEPDGTPPVRAAAKVADEPEPAEGLPPIDAGVYQAALMRGARLYMRRASPEGIVGLGDLGAARVPSYDRDIDVLESPWIQIPVA